jgi:two-component system alkaline phosphatase synthesis response regulator PhoP
MLPTLRARCQELVRERFASDVRWLRADRAVVASLVVCAKVVVAEDDEKQAELIRRYLEHDGHEVVVVHDGRAALEAVRSRHSDLLVLDVMMPKVDGLDVCRILRAESSLPLVLMLTARSSEDDLLLGLDLGADDYMTKPFSPREMVARVRTLIRRARAVPVAVDSALRVGGIAVDPLRHEVTVDGRPIDCTPAEFLILEAMAREPGRVFSRDQLLRYVHGDDRYITTRTIDVHVRNIRKKIEPTRLQPIHLLTVYGIGYKLADAGADGEDRS